MKQKTLAILMALIIATSIIPATANLSAGVIVVTGSNTAPTIILNGTSPVIIERFSTYTDAGAYATDAEDGGLTGNIAVTGTVLVNEVGNYTLTYTVTDSQGVTDTKIRTVEVVDTIAPADVTDVVIGTVTQTTIPLSWSNTNASLSPDFTNVVITVRLHSDQSLVTTWETGGIKRIGKVESVIIDGLTPATAYDITIQTEDDRP